MKRLKEFGVIACFWTPKVLFPLSLCFPRSRGHCGLTTYHWQISETGGCGQTPGGQKRKFGQSPQCLTQGPDQAGHHLESLVGRCSSSLALVRVLCSLFGPSFLARIVFGSSSPCRSPISQPCPTEEPHRIASPNCPCRPCRCRGRRNKQMYMSS